MDYDIKLFVPAVQHYHMEHRYKDKFQGVII